MKQYITVSETAKQLDLSHTTILTYLKQGRLKGKQHPFNNRWMVDKGSVERFKKERLSLKK